jgi:hypothetical protein
MSPAELAWRARSIARDAADLIRIPLGLVPADGGSADTVPAFRLTDVTPNSWLLDADDRESTWRSRLVQRAELLLEHRMTFLGLDNCDLGDPIRWNFDHARSRPTPMGYASRIDYRDSEVAGDCKIVWEPSRHHQLVVLARAFRATGDVRFSREVVAQIESWIDQCPFGRGMQWRSPLELAIRAISWIWAYDLILESGAFDDRRRERFLHTLSLHVWDISRKLSKGSSANNHLIGEAAGVFVATSYFPLLPGAARWRAESASILEGEIIAQTHEDGGPREQAFGYHGFVLQFFLIAGVIARRSGADFSTAYWTRLELMLEFAQRMLEGGPAPTFGDADDGYVLDLGAAPGNVRDWLAIGSALLDRPDFKVVSGDAGEPVRWLLGREALARYDAAELTPTPLRSRAFPHSGYYLLQCGQVGDSDGISVLFDCGELGFGALAAHGHADALSVTLRAFGEDVLVDPGTYDYFSFPEWRQYFRSTPAHNTITVDEAEQSTMLGPFLWGERASARCTHWDGDVVNPSVAGEHDGYRRLADPVMHRRRIELDSLKRVLTIVDEFDCSASHRLSSYFHIAEHCAVQPIGAGVFAIRGQRGSVTLQFDPAYEVSTSVASASPPGGWVSRSYHRRAASTTLRGSTKIEGTARLVCRLTVERQRCE